MKFHLKDLNMYFRREHAGREEEPLGLMIVKVMMMVIVMVVMRMVVVVIMEIC